MLPLRHKSHPSRGLKLALVLAASLPALTVRGGAAQIQVLDEASLLVRRGQTVLARETFTLTQTPERYVVTSVTYYPPRHSRVIHETTAEIGLDSLVQLVIFNSSNGNEERVAAQFNPGRLTIRTASPRGERVREHPMAPRYIVEDDSIFALYVIPPGVSPGEIRVYSPRKGDRYEASIENLGRSATSVMGEERELTQILLRTETTERRIWYDDGGRLMKIVDSAWGITVERVPPGYRF